MTEGYWEFEQEIEVGDEDATLMIEVDNSTGEDLYHDYSIVSIDFRLTPLMERMINDLVDENADEWIAWQKELLSEPDPDVERDEAIWMDEL